MAPVRPKLLKKQMTCGHRSSSTHWALHRIMCAPGRSTTDEHRVMHSDDQSRWELADKCLASTNALMLGFRQGYLASTALLVASLAQKACVYFPRLAFADG